MSQEGSEGSSWFFVDKDQSFLQDDVIVFGRAGEVSPKYQK